MFRYFNPISDVVSNIGRSISNSPLCGKKRIVEEIAQDISSNDSNSDNDNDNDNDNENESD